MLNVIVVGFVCGLILSSPVMWAQAQPKTERKVVTATWQSSHKRQSFIGIEALLVSVEATGVAPELAKQVKADVEKRVVDQGLKLLTPDDAKDKRYVPAQHLGDPRHLPAVFVGINAVKLTSMPDCVFSVELCLKRQVSIPDEPVIVMRSTPTWAAKPVLGITSTEQLATDLRKAVSGMMDQFISVHTLVNPKKIVQPKTGRGLRRVHVFITGRVQGVGFRAFTQSNARGLKLTGWVKNLADGRVEAVIEGPADKVRELLDLVKRGPRWAKVDTLEMKDETPKGDFKQFVRRY